jgi:hypothetical protein
MTAPQIAEQTAFSLDTVTWYLRRFGIPIRQVGFTIQSDIDRKLLGNFRGQGPDDRADRTTVRLPENHRGAGATTL